MRIVGPLVTFPRLMGGSKVMPFDILLPLKTLNITPGMSGVMWGVNSSDIMKESFDLSTSLATGKGGKFMHFMSERMTS